jgi:hypothetical protein
VSQQPGAGKASARLLDMDGSRLGGVTVYAAPIDVHNGMRLASVDPAVDVGATSDESGSFTLENLPPHEYALAVQTPFGIMLPQSQDGKHIIFQVKAGESISLGDQKIDYGALNRLP